MSDVFAKNQATTAADAAKIAPRAEFRVFGHGIIDRVKERMWNGKTVLYQARRMPAETYFLSAATGIAVAFAFIRGFARSSVATIGSMTHRSPCTAARSSARNCVVNRSGRCMHSRNERMPRNGFASRGMSI